MRTVWTLVARGAGVGLLGVAVALAPGCRKSKAQLEQERLEQQRALTERKAAQEQAESTIQREYDAARRLAEKGDSESLETGYKKLEELAAQDEQIAFQFDLYKSEKLPAAVFKKVDELSSVDQERFNEANRLLQFVAENMAKKREEATRRINKIHHLESASRTYRQAEALLKGNQRPAAIEQFKLVRDQYADTPYGDMAIVNLANLERPDEPPGGPPDPQ
jgi:hypothetical protein